ncbi:MAG TPA: hypothetical protein VF411_05155, partial [Bacteroidia bacterium]
MKNLVILLVVIASMAKQTKAQTWVTIPDANFVTYLQSIVSAAMSGNQLDTSSALVTTTTHSINVYNKNIADLSGIQYFTSLTYLDCESNSLTSLPTLPNTLQSLYCYNNSLTNLPVLPNSLQSLQCGGNSLTSVPILPNALLTLYCNGNNITCFPTFPNSITTLSIDPNSYNCLPNYISAMSAADLAVPLCAAGNTNGCAVTNTTGRNQLGVMNDELRIYPNPAKDV